MMDLIVKHILDRVGPFVDKRSAQFDIIFSKVHHPNKQRYERLLAYVDSLLDAWKPNGSEELKYLHIHFPFFEGDQVVVLEYLCIKLFLLTKSDPNGTPSGVGYMREHINLIERELAKDMHLGVDNSKIERKQKTNYRKQIKRIKDALIGLEVLNMDIDRPNYRPKYLVNVLKRDKEELLDISAPSPFFMSADGYKPTDLSRPISYVLLNDQHDLDELDAMQIGELKDILEHIEYIVLFNSDGKSVSRQFNFPDIRRLNAEGLNIKRLVVLSFDAKPFKLEKLISQLNTIVTRFLERTSLPEANSFTIMPWEVDELMGRQSKPRPVIELIGAESLYWREFQEYVNEQEELNELTSIKMRNIYSLCTNEAYKKIVLADLFSNKGTSSPLTIETKDNFKRLTQEEQEELRDLLTHVLDAVQQQRLFARLGPLNDQASYCIILPQTLIDHPALLKLVMEEVRSYLPRATFKGWKDVKSQFEGNIIILDYRDPGRYPFRFHPNILEYTHTHAKSVQAFFLTMFFRYNYEYAQFEYSRVLYSRVIDHPIRKSAFEWDTLLGLIKRRMVDHSYDHLWDLDNNYSNLSEREMVLVTFPKGSKSFYPNELFAARYQHDNRMVILKAEDVHEDRIENRKLFIQPLDDLYEGGNLFETTLAEESEIKVLKSHFYLDDRIPDSGIWKIMLIRMGEKTGAEKVYGEVRAALSRLGLHMVKENYFIDNWLNIKSDLLIPRSKKVFKLLCEYLGLPPVYFRVMLKKRAKERLASRKSNAQMNRLIAKLVEIGLFNDYRPTYTFDKEFMLKYDLEEIGFNVETLANDLYAFVDLCKANLDLREVIYTELKQPS